MTPWSLFCRATGLSSAFAASAFFNGEAYAGWQRDSVREIDIIAGCYLLITRDLWERLGGFDPVFFMYGEEADLCLRAAALGARPLHTPDAPIIHLGGVSEKTRAGKMIKLLAAKATLIDRYFAPLSRPFGHASLAFWPWSRMVGLRLRAWLKPSVAAIEEAAVWQEIWAARSRWKDGFSKTGLSDPSRPLLSRETPLLKSAWLESRDGDDSNPRSRIGSAAQGSRRQQDDLCPRHARNRSREVRVPRDCQSQSRPSPPALSRTVSRSVDGQAVRGPRGVLGRLDRLGIAFRRDRFEDLSLAISGVGRQ